MIPKIIHYCWFGGNPKPDLILKCISSWKKYCPDWEIKEWNEENFDVNQHPFMRDAYAAKKWAFVSDVARLLIIYEHGGIYLDTDVELRSSIDNLTGYDGFFAFQSLIHIATGLGFGASPKHSLVQAMLEKYDNLTLTIKNIVPCPVLNTEAIKSCLSNPNMNGEKTVAIKNCIFLSADDFGKIGYHHGMQSWVDGPKFEQASRKRTKLGLWVQSKLKYPENFAFIEKHLGKKALKIYTFVTYDLFDCGIGFFFLRLLHKIKRK